MKTRFVIAMFLTSINGGAQFLGTFAATGHMTVGRSDVPVRLNYLSRFSNEFSIAVQ